MARIQSFIVELKKEEQQLKQEQDTANMLLPLDHHFTHLRVFAVSGIRASHTKGSTLNTDVMWQKSAWLFSCGAVSLKWCVLWRTDAV